MEAYYFRIMKVEKLFIWGIISFLLIQAGQAQINDSRNFTVSTMDDTTTEATFLGHAEYAAEAMRGYGSADNEQAWNFKFIGLLEIYRYRKSSLSFVLSNELIANPYNEIKYNPRGSIWCESITFYNKQKYFTFEAGIDHRCKHEIDNSDQPNEFLSADGYTPAKRVVILTGAHAGMVSNTIELNSKMSIRAFARAELYAASSDSRIPDNIQSQSWDNAWGSALLGVKFNFNIRKNLEIYNRNWISPVFFTNQDKAIQSNYRNEIGFHASGKKAGMEVYSSYEHYFDDLSHPYPQSSNVLSIGLRIRSKLFF
jgi:hypothetical protein